MGAGPPPCPSGQPATRVSDGAPVARAARHCCTRTCYAGEKGLLKVLPGTRTTEKPAPSTPAPMRDLEQPRCGRLGRRGRGEGLGSWRLLHGKRTGGVCADTAHATFLHRGEDPGVQVQLVQVHFFRAATTETHRFPGTWALRASVSQTAQRPPRHRARLRQHLWEPHPVSESLAREKPQSLSPQHPLSRPQLPSALALPSPLPPPGGQRADPRALAPH